MAAVRAQIHHGLKLSKGERKILKKQNKALYSLISKEPEVGEISNSPTPYLLVKNGGLTCGIKRQDLFNELHKHGKLEDLVMLPRKSYSYALFLTAESAKKAMMSLNGQKLINETSLSGTTLYLAYLAKKPCLQLSSLSKTYPFGMILIEDFINEFEESRLLQCFSNRKEREEITESEMSVQKQLKHRYVKHFGYEFIYGSNTVDKEKPLPNGIPQECLPVIEKIMSLECVKHRPDQLTVNEYLPGQGIPPHIDTHSAFEDGIISLSLGAKVAMDFRHPDGRHLSVLLPRRSILLMTEDCRYVWSHGITPRKYDVVNEDYLVYNESETSEDPSCIGQLKREPYSSPVTILPRETRLSLTFRTVRRNPCDCKFPTYCDSQSRLASPRGKTDEACSTQDCPLVPESEKDAIDLERQHVYNVYENIAEHFSGTRHSPWPKIAAFLKSQSPGSIVADVGCGNGKYLGLNNQLFMSGSDRSLNLASICRQRGFQVIVCDILSLPYRSNAFDVCICIAVIHHLSTPARRLAALKELTRIVRPGGRILVSVWAFEQNLKNAEVEAIKKGAKGQRNFDVAAKSQETPLPSTDSSLINSSSLAKMDNQFASSLCSVQQPSSWVPAKTLETCQPSTNSSIENSPAETDFHFNTNYCSAQLINSTEMLKSAEYNADILSSKTSPVKLKVNASRNAFEQQDLLVPWHYRGQKKTSKDSDTFESSCLCGSRLVDLKNSDIKKSNLKEEQVFQRFYHVYKENELVDDCKKLNNIFVVRKYYDKGNWCVELEKLADKE